MHPFIIPDTASLRSCSLTPAVLRVIIVDDIILPVAQRGLLHTSHFSIPDVAHIPQPFMNLISVSQLAAHGYVVIFDDFACHV